MPTLIVYLPTELPQASSQVAYLVTPDGRTVGAHSSAALALLPAPAGVEVVAVVPAQALSWHLVQLPRGLLRQGLGAERANPRLRAVLEGQLEEHLLDEPAQLHFALAPEAQDGAPLQVAACDRAWLRAWMQALEQHQRPAARIVPEFAQPLQAVHVLGPEASPLLVFSQSVGASMGVSMAGATGAAGIVVLPLNPATAGLAALPASAAGTASAAALEDIVVLAEPSVAAIAEHHFRRPVRLQSRPERWLAAAQSPWDLAQFDLVSSSRLRSWRRFLALFENGWRAPEWRPARWAAVALVAANLVGLNAWAWAQRASLDAKRQAVREVLTGAFPGVKVVIDAPVQMTRELQRLRVAAGAASTGDFELLLAAYGHLAVAGANVSARKAEAMEYTSNELRVKGLGLSRANLDEMGAQARLRSVVLRLDADTLVLSPAAPASLQP